MGGWGGAGEMHVSEYGVRARRRRRRDFYEKPSFYHFTSDRNLSRYRAACKRESMRARFLGRPSRFSHGSMINDRPAPWVRASSSTHTHTHAHGVRVFTWAYKIIRTRAISLYPQTCALVKRRWLSRGPLNVGRQKQRRFS